MNVLIVSQFFWPERFRINDLAEGLLSRDVKVTVLTGFPNYPNGKFYPGYRRFLPHEEIHQDMRIVRVPLFPRGKGGALALFFNYVSFALSASFFAPFLLREKYDAIVVFQTSPITAALPAIVMKKIQKIPLFLWIQDLWPESLAATGMIKNKTLLSIVGCFVRWIYRHSNRVLVQSKAFTASIQQQGIPLDKIVYFPNWAESFYQPLLVSVEPIFLKGFLILFAGNLGRAQSLETIVSAATLLRDYTDIHWIFVGDGVLKNDLEFSIKAKKLEDYIHCYPSVPAEKMPQYFANVDVLLVTLAKQPIFSFTIPSKIASYLACAKPIVGALDGAGQEVIVESGAGFAGGAEDAKVLSENVLRLYQLSADKRKQLGEAGRQYYQVHFEREALIDQLVGWLKKS